MNSKLDKIQFTRSRPKPREAYGVRGACSRFCLDGASANAHSSPYFAPKPREASWTTLPTRRERFSTDLARSRWSPNPKRQCSSAALLLLLGAFLFTGCLSRKPLNKETFAFSLPQSTHVSAPSNAPALTIRQITVAAPFDSPSLTYRTGEFSYERDPYAAFLVSPAESLTGPVRARLENSGKFSTVTDTDSSYRANVDLEISVTQLYGDFRDQSQPTAVLEMRFVLFQPKERFDRTNRANIVFEKTYSRRIPLKTRTARGVVEGLNTALDQIVTQFANDVPQK